MVDHNLTEYPIDGVIVWLAVVDEIESLMKSDQCLTGIVTEIN